MRTLALTVAAVAWSASAVAQQPRDNRPAETSGTATISGIVVSDEREPKPLRRARVTLNGGELSVGRTAITADNGSFSFERLPAGRYTLGVSKDGYVAMNFGARRPGRPGARVVVANGEQRAVTVRMPRGAVITGVLTSEDGQPVAGLSVFVLTPRFSISTGGRQLVPIGNPFAAAPTDDRGVYRIYGLPSGDYAVAAYVRPGADASRIGGDLRAVSPAEVRAAIAAVRAGARSPQTATAPAAPMDLPAEPQKSVTLAPVYYPGTAVAERATLVTVSQGEERTGVDFSVQYVPVATLEGYTSPSDPTAPTFVMLTSETNNLGLEGPRTARTTPEGRFTFTGIAPGNYTLSARMNPRPATPGEAPQTLFAVTQVVVAGEDIGGLSLALQPGLTISGRVAFEGTSIPDVDFTRLRVFLPAAVITGGGAAGSLPQPQLQPDGRFTLPGVPPGPYRFMTLTIQGMRSPIGRWWLKSVTIRGREMLDAPLEFRESADDAVITFSERANELSGTVAESPEGAVMDGYVIVFPADRRGWFQHSRRVAAVRPTAEGRYSVRNLPAGNYLVAGTADVENLEWWDPRFLEALAARAVRVSIVDSEDKSLNLAWIR